MAKASQAEAARRESKSSPSAALGMHCRRGGRDGWLVAWKYAYHQLHPQSGERVVSLLV
jgi:hypothetical protein